MSLWAHDLGRAMRIQRDIGALFIVFTALTRHPSTGLWPCACMQAFYSDHFVLPLPEGHRFPMAKYRMQWLNYLPRRYPAAETANQELRATNDPMVVGRWLARVR